MGSPGGEGFFTGTTVLESLRYATLALKWLTVQPVWVLQSSLEKKKLDTLKPLVQERLVQGHTEPSMSPVNTLVFVIEKKSAKWRLLHDLRKINSAMESMGAVQPRVSSPTMIPANCDILIVDLSDQNMCAGSCHTPVCLPGWAGCHFRTAAAVCPFHG